MKWNNLKQESVIVCNNLKTIMRLIENEPFFIKIKFITIITEHDCMLSKIDDIK